MLFGQKAFLAFFAFASWFWLWSHFSSSVHGALLERKFQAPSFCFLDRDHGPCSFVRRVWYFDHRTRRCSRFAYGGCRGNANRFESRRACLRTCTGAGSGADTEDNGDDEETTASLSKPGLGAPPVIVIDSWDAICLQHPSATTCPADTAGQGRYWYFYNASSGSCEEFLYFGCGGNNNRFATSADCRMACGHVGARWKVHSTYSKPSSAPGFSKGAPFQAVKIATRRLPFAAAKPTGPFGAAVARVSIGMLAVGAQVSSFRSLRDSPVTNLTV